MRVHFQIDPDFVAMIEWVSTGAVYICVRVIKVRCRYKTLRMLGSVIAVCLVMSNLQADTGQLESKTAVFPSMLLAANASTLASETLDSKTLDSKTLDSKEMGSQKKASPKSAAFTANKATNKQTKQNSSAGLQNSKQLDAETERLLKEILNLSSDLAILEEQQNTPAKHQLLVMVTMKPTRLFDLDYVELKIDNHTVAAYNYTPSDVRALKMGGGHRLYLALLPAGTHKLSATMAGRIPRDPDYNREVDYDFVSGKGRIVVELVISSEQSNSFPILAVKEWQ